ncbi:MAG: hypothetical protein IJS86_07145 [Lachnospiraceae bacterium]|nr:hypothetical protein [Lachnospiraceae bacterium]
MSNANRILPVIIMAGAFLLNAKSLGGEFQDRISLYRPGFSDQTMYMTEFKEEGRYPDAFLRALVRDKKVAVWADFSPYSNYPSYGHDHSDDPAIDIFFSGDYYYDNNYGNFFRKYAKEGVTDGSLPSPEEVRKAKILKNMKDSFVQVGYTADMERYAFMLNDDPEYVNSYFHYSYYYYTCVGEAAFDTNFRMFIADEDIENAEELVAIWDDRENLYVMSREFYDNNILKLF